MARYRNAKSNLAEARPPGPTHYRWQAPGRTDSIHLNFEVIGRLQNDVMKAFWAVPKRGAEVGGILLGHTVAGEDGTSVYIDHFEPVECEHRRGPSFMLSEADRRRLEKALRKAGADYQIVGFYRSHTRLGLYLDEHDYSLIQAYFSSPQHVFLLIRPQHDKPCAAGFFFWEDGHIHRQSTYLEFPFGREELLPAPAAVPQPVAPPPAMPQPPAAATTTVALTPIPVPRAEFQPGPVIVPAPVLVPREPRVIVRWRLGWRSVGLAAAVLLGFGSLEYAGLQMFARHDRSGFTAAAGQTALRVERTGNYLHVNWDRNAPAVLRASRAVLAISDGATRQELELDAGQLRTGSVAYFPSTNDVSFRLQLLGPQAATESLRVVMAPPGEQPVRAEPAPPPEKPHVQVIPAAREPLVRKAQIKRPRPRRAFFDDGL